MIDKHTNVATAAAGDRRRGIDEYHAVEEDLLCGKGDKAAVMSLLDATGGAPRRMCYDEDHRRHRRGELSAARRAATLPPTIPRRPGRAWRRRWSPGRGRRRLGLREADGQPERARRGAGGPRRRRRGRRGRGFARGAERTGQSISQIAKGVKSLLDERRLAVARATESPMANQPSPETEAFAVFDPKAPRRSDGEGVPGVTGPAPRRRMGGARIEAATRPSTAAAFARGAGRSRSSGRVGTSRTGARIGGRGGGAGTRSVVTGARSSSPRRSSWNSWARSEGKARDGRGTSRSWE